MKPQPSQMPYYSDYIQPSIPSRKLPYHQDSYKSILPHANVSQSTINFLESEQFEVSQETQSHIDTIIESTQALVALLEGDGEGLKTYLKKFYIDKNEETEDTRKEIITENQSVISNGKKNCTNSIQNNKDFYGNYAQKSNPNSVNKNKHFPTERNLNCPSTNSQYNGTRLENLSPKITRISSDVISSKEQSETSSDKIFSSNLFISKTSKKATDETINEKDIEKSSKGHKSQINRQNLSREEKKCFFETKDIINQFNQPPYQKFTATQQTSPLFSITSFSDYTHSPVLDPLCTSHSKESCVAGENKFSQSLANLANNRYFEDTSYDIIEEKYHTISNEQIRRAPQPELYWSQLHTGRDPNLIHSPKPLSNILSNNETKLGIKADKGIEILNKDRVVYSKNRKEIADFKNLSEIPSSQISTYGFQEHNEEYSLHQDSNNTSHTSPSPLASQLNKNNKYIQQDRNEDVDQNYSDTSIQIISEHSYENELTKENRTDFINKLEVNNSENNQNYASSSSSSKKLHRNDTDENCGDNVSLLSRNTDNSTLILPPRVENDFNVIYSPEYSSFLNLKLKQERSLLSRLNIPLPHLKLNKNEASEEKVKSSPNYNHIYELYKALELIIRRYLAIGWTSWKSYITHIHYEELEANLTTESKEIESLIERQTTQMKQDSLPYIYDSLKTLKLTYTSNQHLDSSASIKSSDFIENETYPIITRERKSFGLNRFRPSFFNLDCLLKGETLYKHSYSRGTKKAYKFQVIGTYLYWEHRNSTMMNNSSREDRSKSCINLLKTNGIVYTFNMIDLAMSYSWRVFCLIGNHPTIQIEALTDSQFYIWFTGLEFILTQLNQLSFSLPIEPNLDSFIELESPTSFTPNEASNTSTSLSPRNPYLLKTQMLSLPEDFTKLIFCKLRRQMAQKSAQEGYTNWSSYVKKNILKTINSM